MAKSMNDLLKGRMAASRQASELAASDEAYQKIFPETPPPSAPMIRDVEIRQLVPFFTADIGFKPYSQEKIRAFAEQLKEEGLLVRIIVRPIAESGDYEILAGHNRVCAARVAGWTKIGAEIVEADDARAIVIATSTNLIQRQCLSVVERGRAYKALLDAKNRNGQHGAALETFGDSRQRYNARKLVAEFFDVTEYEIRKAVKLTQLIPSLLDIMEQTPKQLNLACADLIADYDTDSQEAFVEMCSIEGYQINKATVQYIVRQCPPPTAERQAVFAAWREYKAAAERRHREPPKKITFDRKKFAPYMDSIGSDAELENLFLEFLRQRAM